MSQEENSNRDLMSHERLQQGYVIILPGIEGQSFLNRSIRRGLVNAGLPYGIEIHDWTRGLLRYLWNLRDRNWHREQTQVIAGKIIEYRRTHPTQPVYLVGHSGGGAMTVFALAALPPEVQATAGILIVAALSPGYDLAPALRQTQQGLWNYCSYGDVFLGVGTTILGTCDGYHGPAAGMLGCRGPQAPAAFPSGAQGIPPLRQIRFQWRMIRQFNLGGHFTCANPCFIRRWIAPLLTGRHGEAG